MIVLKTQSPAYWQKEFAVDDHDLELMHEVIIDAGSPTPVSALAQAVIKDRCRREVDARRSELDRGPMFQPKDGYTVGQTIVFPAMGFAVAKIIGTRPGFDPARGEFEVIKVEFEGAGEQREFASKLKSPHPLNRPDDDDGLTFVKNSVAPDQLYNAYGADITAKLLERLNAADDTDFVEYQSGWLVREMMAEVNVGHLNIAEAAIDVAGAPLSTEQIVRNLDLPGEVSADIQRFSLNAALAKDERFDDVGWDGQVMWFLRRMEPAEVHETPSRLRALVEPYDAKALNPDLLALTNELDDDVSPQPATPLENVYSANVTLTYPHMRSGTLPLSPRVRALFPKGSYQRTRIELVDGQRGETMIGWLNHEQSYLAGLTEWYKRYQIPAGATLRLERTKRPTVVIVNFEPRRMRREWVRVAGVTGGALSISLQKRAISCEYDETMAVDHADILQLDDYAQKVLDEGRPLASIVREVVPELIKLSPAGSVHAKTIYSAVSTVCRCAPAAVFAILSTQPIYMNLGAGMWAFDESREKR